jgi:phenylacetate-CoA ligase
MIVAEDEGLNNLVADRLDVLKAELIDQALWFPRMFEYYERYRAGALSGAVAEGAPAQQLGMLLKHCIQTVPFYRSRFGGAEKSIDAAALAELPIVDKDQIADDVVNFVTDAIDRYDVRRSHTSGTSGRRSTVYMDVEWLARANALSLLRMERMGVPWFRKTLRPFHWLKGWLEYTAPAAGLARVGQFSTLSVGTLDLDELLFRVRGFQPDVISATPSNILAFAELMERAGAEQDISPMCLTTGGEQLTDATRARVEGVFGLPVINTYAMAEVSTIAWECVHRTMHVESERILVEIVDEAGNPVSDGMQGDVVVTDLHNEVMPHVRYRTGDVGSLATLDCPCGRSGRVMQRIDGRRPARIVLSEGATMDAFPLVKILMRARVVQFQLVQVDEGHLLARITPEQGTSSDAFDDLRELLVKEARGLLDVKLVTAAIQDYATNESGKVVDFVPLVS